MTLLPRLTVLFLAIAATACGDEEAPSKLFDEDGAWAVIQYDLGENVEEIDPQTREDAFMLSFDNANRVVTAASCVGLDSDGMPDAVTPEDSPCRLLPQDTAWQCRCFAYAFRDDVMQFQEFAAGSMPPRLAFDPLLDPGEVGGDDSGGGSGSGGGGGDGGVAALRVVPIPDRKSTYDFRPLPAGVFGGDGVANHFILKARSNSIFDEVYMDPDGRDSCMRCVPE